MTTRGIYGMLCPNCATRMEREPHAEASIHRPPNWHMAVGRLEYLYWCEECGLEARVRMWESRSAPKVIVTFDPRRDNGDPVERRQPDQYGWKGDQ